MLVTIPDTDRAYAHYDRVTGLRGETDDAQATAWEGQVPFS